LALVAADGHSSSTVTVTLVDSSGDPVSGKSVSLAQGSGHSTIATVSGVTNTHGQAVFAVTDTTPETVTYQATDSTDHVAIQATAKVQFFASTLQPSLTRSTVCAQPISVPADGVTYSTITVTLLAGNGAAVAGRTVTLLANGGHSKIVAVSAVTNAAGQAVFRVTDNTTERVSYSAVDTTDDLTLNAQATVDFASCHTKLQAEMLSPPVLWADLV